MQSEKGVGVGFGVMILRTGKIILGKRHDDPEKASSLLHGEGTLSPWAFSVRSSRACQWLWNLTR
ncbi:hypothetical protein AUJ69_00310 [Candidatus Woesearchaeota archaeon CG1_02_47_18]|nr:MAG: hypothetical protein AUJ69_00310 [Candidatus Woesearchaeota archaeon CG1_02_47_18]